MTKDGGETAFPLADQSNDYWAQGMSLRDWFAGHALAGIAARGEKPSLGQARAAYEMADAMLVERERCRG